MTRARYVGEENHLTITQALASLQTPQWQQAMNRELALLEKYQVYEWVNEVPAGRKVSILNG